MLNLYRDLLLNRLAILEGTASVPAAFPPQQEMRLHFTDFADRCKFFID